MTSRESAQPLLDDEHAAFIQSGISIIAASGSADNVPSLDRALGCKVSPDRRRVTIFLSVSSARRLLDDIRRSGRIAVVFSEPPTHRTIQLKGKDAAIVATASADHEIVKTHAEAMVRSVVRIGNPEPVVRAVMTCPFDELTAVAFTPSSAFVQTPGPRAGAPLKA
jgi:hypothetical protein